MSSLRDIRNRLHSVENIKKITDAIEKIAAVRLRRAQLKAEKSLPYFSKIKEAVENLSSFQEKNPLFEQREIKKTGLVVISADKGLAGSYSGNILTAADRFLKKYSTQSIELFLFGRKALEYYQRRQWTIHYHREGWGEAISFSEIKEFSDQLVNRFKAKELDEIWIIFTSYISVMKRNVVTEKFLNFESIKEKKSSIQDFIFEPKPAEILDSILPRYCAARIQTALYESYASELAARIISMQTASKNSEEMIEKLTLHRNKVRQEGITKEIIEISSGAEH